MLYYFAQAASPWLHEHRFDWAFMVLYQVEFRALAAAGVAFAIVLLRESGVPTSDKRIQRGVSWLKQNQRATGRWWMHSLYRGNYNYITYIATAQVLRALALCDELPTISRR